MRASTDVHDLIHALSPSEKRYFRIFAARHVQNGQNNYMLIFDWMEQQAVYNEEAILGQITDRKLKAQYAVQKSYLYKLILKSLRNFHAEVSVDFQIKELLMNVELLLRKDLVSHSLKQLSKAERLALDNERYEHLFEISGYKISLLLKAQASDLDKMAKSLQAVFEETSAYFQQFQNVQAFRRLSLQLLVMNRRDQQAQSVASQVAYREIMSDPLLGSMDNALSKRAELYYLQAWFIHHFSRADYAGSFDCAGQMVALMENHAHLVAERPENYVNTLQNQVMMSTLFMPPAESLALIERLKGFAERFPNIRFDEATERRVPVFAANLELHILLNSGQYPVAAQRLPQALATLDAQGYRYNVNEGYVVVDLYFKAARIYLFQRDYRRALSYVNRILTQEGLSSQFEAYLSARILNVVILFEAGEEQLLDYALTSLYRFLKEKKKLFKFERALIDFIRKAQNAGGGKGLEVYLRKLRDDLKRVSEIPGEPLGLMQFNILDWLNTRLTDAGVEKVVGRAAIPPTVGE